MLFRVSCSSGDTSQNGKKIILDVSCLIWFFPKQKVNNYRLDLQNKPS